MITGRDIVFCCPRCGSENHADPNCQRGDINISTQPPRPDRAQVAEDARREAHGESGCCLPVNDRHPCGFDPHPDKAKRHAAIDRAIAARAVEVAEGMHVRGCDCHDFEPLFRRPGTCAGACSYADEAHPWIDPRCLSMRDRLRAELAALGEGKDAK